MLTQHSAGPQLLTLAPPDRCMCVLYTHVYVYTPIWMCTDVWKPEAAVRRIPSSLALYIEAGSHLSPKFTDQLVSLL